MMVSELINATAILDEITKKTGTSDPDSEGNYEYYKSQLSSISEKASRNVAYFPVIMTSPPDTISADSVTKTKTSVLLGLTKFIECECARFLITAAGMDPVIDVTKMSIGKKLSSLTGYGYNYTYESASENLIKLATEAHLENDPDVFYDSVPNKTSLEATVTGYNPVPSEDIKGDTTGGYISKATETGIDKRSPSVVNIKFILNNGGSFKEYEIPVIVKASPYFVASEEMKEFIKEVSTGSNIISKLIRLKARDIKFWKDIVFDYENIERYRKSHDKFGRWPIAMKLKDDTFFKKVTAFFRAIPPIRKFISGSSNTMPMASIICTKQEISEANSKKWRDIIRNPQCIYRMMSKLSVLSFSVIDEDAEMTYTYFSGIKDPYVNTFSDLVKNDRADKTVSILENLIKFMQVQQRRM